MNREMIVGKQE